MTRTIPMLCLLVVTAPAGMAAQGSGERAAVVRAAMDYLDGSYEGDSTKLLRSVRPEVQKYGYYIPRNGTRYEGEPMTFQEMLDYARNVRTTGRGAPPPNPPKQVEILDLLDQTAAAKVTAWWGTDYLHLAKYDGR